MYIFMASIIISLVSLCKGETGIGKSTLMESLFKEQFNDQPVSHRLKSVSVNHKTYGGCGLNVLYIL